LWEPLVFNKVLDNWTIHPFVEIKLIDYTQNKYKSYWDKTYVPEEGEEQLTKLESCGKGFEEIGMGYWYGMEDGCICNGEFGGDLNEGKYPALSTEPCNAEQLSVIGCRPVSNMDP